MPTIDYTKEIQIYNENVPTTPDAYVKRLHNYRSSMSQWRSMLLYTLWHGVKTDVIPLGKARDFVNENMADILGHYSDNEDYIKALAGIVDIIILDMLYMHRADSAYLFKESSAMIQPEDIIFNPLALSNAYTFKGFYQETIKWVESGKMSYDETYEIRQTLLNMFMTDTRDEIRAFIAEVRADIIQEENDGANPVTVIEVEMSGDELESNIVTLELDEKAFNALNTWLGKKYAVTLYRVDTES